MFKFAYILLFFSCAKKSFPYSVKDFDINKYSGTWYEIARLNHSFEEGCVNVSATYIERKDGGIDIINKCTFEGKESIAKGVGYFKGDKTIGSLKVSFFWPIYADYNIVHLDKDYQHALVVSDNPNYMWILSRSEKLDKEIIEKLLKKAESIGIDTKKAVFSEVG